MLVIYTILCVFFMNRFCVVINTLLQDGGFYSAEDADSYPKIGDAHKKEGAFCVWEERDLRRLLVEEVPGNPGVSNADVFAHHFDVKPKGNVNPSQVWWLVLFGGRNAP